MPVVSSRTGLARVTPFAGAASVARALAPAALALALAGCVTPQAFRVVEVAPAPPPRPMAVPPPPTAGAIYAAGSYRPLFEDLRARRIGDMLTININEKLDASKSASTTADHTGKMDFNVPTAQIAGRGIQGGTLSTESKNNFEGKGDSAANNVFTGSITVTVVDVLPNGYLIVRGEKQIGINTGSEFIRLSGIVNPATILSGNVVSSTQVAEARLEYRGSGTIDEAQTMGWLSRTFMSVMPF